MLDINRALSNDAFSLDPLFLDSEGDSPIELSGDDLRRFQYRFHSALDKADSEMTQIHADAEQDRKVFKTVPRVPAYEGGPDITSPVTADFGEGILAHIKDAIEMRPLVSFSPEGVGPSAETATEIAPIYEALLEREINRSDSREIIANELAHEAVVTGTAIVRLSLAQHPDELFVQTSRTIRLENFFVDRITARDLTNVTCAYRYKERLYNLEEQAEQGYLDKDAVAKLRSHYSSDEEEIAEEGELQFDESTAFAEENTLHTLYCGYMRFAPAGDTSKLYEIYYHRDTRTILALRENPAKDAYDAPPLALVRIGKQPGFLFGRGVARRLESEQKVADNAINTHLALNNVAAAPPVNYNVNNPIARKLAQSRALEPNMWIPNYGPPDKNDILPISIPNPGLALQDYQISLQMAQRRTYTDESLGQSGSTRKTLGQYRMEVSKGTLKLRLDLGDFAYDMARMLKMYWSMVVAYKVEPAGILTVDPAGKLLGNREYPGEELAQAVVEVGSGMLLNGEMQVQDMAEIDQHFNKMLTAGRVPSAKRQDLTLSLSGTRIIADKLGEVEMEVQLMPIVLNLIEGARVDTYINYWGRSILRKAGFTDLEKRWPQDPGQMVLNPFERFMLMQPANEVIGRNSSMF